MTENKIEPKPELLPKNQKRTRAKPKAKNDAVQEAVRFLEMALNQNPGKSKTRTEQFIDRALDELKKVE